MEGDDGPPPGAEVGELDAAQFQRALAAAARAFQDEAGFRFVMPEPRRRARVLRDYVETVLRCGQRYGEIHAPRPEPVGAAVWLPPPGRLSISIGRLLRCGVLRGMIRTRPTELLRLKLLGVVTGILATECPSDPHWYLWLLAVEPGFQGRGLGSALLQPVLRRADETGAPCVLDTMEERSARFYQRHGFEVAARRQCPFGGPGIWVMRRPPGGA